MCIKYIYHNRYLDGEDVTERVDSCYPGYLCANPRVRELERSYNCSKLQANTGRSSPSLPRASAYYAEDRHIRPASPLTPPGSRGSDGERRRRSSSGAAYLDGTRLVSPRRPREPRPVVLEPRRGVPYAPEPPAPRPIPIKRASTMPYGMETPPAEQRGRRPIIVEERVPTTTRHAVDAAPVEIREHASAARLRRRSSHRNADFLYPARRSDRSPQGYASAEDEAEKRERRRRRRDAQAQAAGMATSVPTVVNADLYGSSYGSSYNSSLASSPVIGASPAVAAVKKTLRWEDQQRAQQNARIDARPKLKRASTTAGGGGVQGEVKSILKNSGSAGASPALEPTRIGDDDLAELYRSVEGMNLNERETSAERRARGAEEKDSAAYMDRLRNRFSMPPRRFTAGTGARRRTEIWYPDEGRYKYL